MENTVKVPVIIDTDPGDDYCPAIVTFLPELMLGSC